MREFHIIFLALLSYLIFCSAALWFISSYKQVIFFCSGGVLSHTFELEAKSKGVFSGEPAVIKFRVPTNAALQV